MHTDTDTYTHTNKHRHLLTQSSSHTHSLTHTSTHTHSHTKADTHGTPRWESNDAVDLLCNTVHTFCDTYSDNSVMALKKLGTVPVKPQSAKCSASMNVKLPKYSGSVTRSSALNDAANSCRLVSRDTASGMVPDRSFKLTLM